MAKTNLGYLGIDVGTSAVKAVLVSQDGRILVECDAQQDVSMPRPGWTEQHPETWWDSTVTAVKELMQKANALPDNVEIAAIGLSGQMHSSVFLDAQGDVIRPALLWNDVRTTHQRQQITERLGIAGLNRMVGNLALEGFTAPKVLWLRDNEPENFSYLKTLLLPKDYVRYRLTGELATEPSDAAGTILYDVRNRQWSQEMLTALDIPADILPRVVESTEVSGRLSQTVADELGLPAGIPVVGGGADNAAGAVGSGVVTPGRVQSSIGTSGTLLLPTPQPYVDDVMRLHTFCHCDSDLWYLMGTILSAASSLSWLRDIMASDLSYAQLDAEAENVPVGSDGLFFLPYLTGERTPHNDANARGVFFGLHFGHGRGAMVRAVMEGVTFALRDSLEIMREQGASFDEVRAIGGGARSRLWLQMQADIFNTPVITLSASAGPAYGAALMAAVGVNQFASIAEGVDQWVQPGETLEPNKANAQRYDQLYQVYRSLYPAFKERFAEVAKVNESLGGSLAPPS